MADTAVNTTEKSKESKNAKEKKPKKSWLKGLKGEFAKIIWPDRETLMRESTAVIIISVALGLLIAVVDWVIRAGINVII